jgi:hypothetical protein
MRAWQYPLLGFSFLWDNDARSTAKNFRSQTGFVLNVKLAPMNRKYFLLKSGRAATKNEQKSCLARHKKALRDLGFAPRRNFLQYCKKIVARLKLFLYIRVSIYTTLFATLLNRDSPEL